MNEKTLKPERKKRLTQASQGGPGGGVEGRGGGFKMMVAVINLMFAQGGGVTFGTAGYWSNTSTTLLREQRRIRRENYYIALPRYQ